MVYHNSRLHIVSGGPGSGKTTLLLELKRRGFQYVPEVARQIIQQQVDVGGDALPWANREAYTALMLERSIDSYLQCASISSTTFADRGIPDSLCYARLVGLTGDIVLSKACRTYRYASIVFLAPPWQEIYATDTERRQSFAEAVQTGRLMEQVYRELGYTVVTLPCVSPAQRATFVLHTLGL